MDKQVKDILFRTDIGTLGTLEEVYDKFKYILEKYEMIPTNYMIDIRNDKDKKTIELSFKYKYISSDLVEKENSDGVYESKDNQKCTRILNTTIPDNPQFNWSIHQVLYIMRDMYLLKLNEQILTKQIKR
jgi:hypothetical protein